jgi:hypothetical protein
MTNPDTTPVDDSYPESWKPSYIRERDETLGHRPPTHPPTGPPLHPPRNPTEAAAQPFVAPEEPPEEPEAG